MLFACEKIVAHSMHFVFHTQAFWVSLCRIPPITICLVFLDLIYKMLIVLSVIRTNNLHARTHTYTMPSLRNTGHLLIPWAPYICICSDYQRYLCWGGTCLVWMKPWVWSHAPQNKTALETFELMTCLILYLTLHVFLFYSLRIIK